MKKEQTECSETSVYKIQTPGNYPEQSIKSLSFVFSSDVAKKLPCSVFILPMSRISASGFGGLEVACWPLVPKFEGSNQHAFLRRGSKAVGPML